MRRGISQADVMRVAAEPEQVHLIRADREVRQSRVTDPTSGKLQLIRVVVDCGEENDEVVTAYRTSKIAKYWRAQ
jgi:hypothetical protein